MAPPLISFHPETADEKLLVSNPETRDFSFWQGNQGAARRLPLKFAENYRDSES
jgi:hypothetical protein